MVGAVLVARELRSRRAIDLQDRVVLITGGSRGLGLLMAREVGRLGARVVLVARDEAELQRAQQNLTVTRCRGDDPRRRCGCRIGGPAAGRGSRRAARATRRADQQRRRHPGRSARAHDRRRFRAGDGHALLGTASHDAARAIPHMRRRGGGRIVNISSIGGRIGVPHLVPVLRQQVRADRAVSTRCGPSSPATGFWSRPSAPA